MCLSFVFGFGAELVWGVIRRQTAGACREKLSSLEDLSTG